MMRAGCTNNDEGREDTLMRMRMRVECTVGCTDSNNDKLAHW